MPALFAGLEDRLSAEIDRVFGESFLFLPMTQPTVNSRLGPDAARLQLVVTGVLDDRNPGSTSFERLGKSAGGVATHGGKPQFATSSPLLFIDEKQFGPQPPDFRRLDRFRRQDTGDVYEVTGVEKDGQGRWKIGLVKVAKD